MEQRAQVDEITKGLRTNSEKIRALTLANYDRTEISQMLAIGLSACPQMRLFAQEAALRGRLRLRLLVAPELLAGRRADHERQLPATVPATVDESQLSIWL